MSISLFVEEFDTLCGPLSIVFDEEETLLHLDFPDQGARQLKMLTTRFKNFDLTVSNSHTIKDHIIAYMDGDFSSLEQISNKTGGTAFQQRVWQALKTIPLGQTISYLDLSKRLGNEKAVRAVARANALNPISLIYPCHRVIGSNGKLTGYAGGLMRKEWLLRHEGAWGT